VCAPQTNDHSLHTATTAPTHSKRAVGSITYSLLIPSHLSLLSPLFPSPSSHLKNSARMMVLCPLTVLWRNCVHGDQQCGAHKSGPSQSHTHGWDRVAVGVQFTVESARITSTRRHVHIVVRGGVTVCFSSGRAPLFWPPLETRQTVTQSQ
jgi:hypothetical protein